MYFLEEFCLTFVYFVKTTNNKWGHTHFSSFFVWWESRRQAECGLQLDCSELSKIYPVLFSFHKVPKVHELYPRWIAQSRGLGWMNGVRPDHGRL